MTDPLNFGPMNAPPSSADDNTIPIDSGRQDDPWQRERELFEQAWESVRDESSSRRERSSELSELVNLIAETLRNLFTAETFKHWEEAVRRLLIALRDLIDAALSRLDRDKTMNDVEDIPID